MTRPEDTHWPAVHLEYAELAAGCGLAALEPDDEQRLAAHVLSCALCARLVAEAAALGAALADAVGPRRPDLRPPPELRDRLLAAAHRESPAAADGAWSPLRTPARQRAGIQVAALVLAASAGAAVAAPATLVATHSTRRPAASTFAAAVTAPGAREATLRGGGGALAKAVLSAGELWLVTNRLPRNSPETTYVLWRADPAVPPTAVATFDVPSGGPQTLRWPAPAVVRDAAALAISYEPGRRAPRRPTDVVLTGRLSSPG